MSMSNATIMSIDRKAAKAAYRRFLKVRKRNRQLARKLAREQKHLNRVMSEVFDYA